MVEQLVTMVRMKTMVDKSVRIELDLGEISPAQVARLHELYMSGEHKMLLGNVEDWPHLIRQSAENLLNEEMD